MVSPAHPLQSREDDLKKKKNLRFVPKERECSCQLLGGRRAKTAAVRFTWKKGEIRARKNRSAVGGDGAVGGV